MDEASARMSKVKHIYSLPYRFSGRSRNEKQGNSDVGAFSELRISLGSYIYTFSWPNISKSCEIYFFKESHGGPNARKLYNSLKRVGQSWMQGGESLYQGLKKVSERSPSEISRMMESLASYIFATTVSDNLGIRAQLQESQVMPWSLCYGLDEILRAMADFISAYNQLDMDKGHKAEPIAAIKGFIQDVNYSTIEESFFLFLWGGMIIYSDTAHKQIDGLWVIIERTQYRVYMIETKTSKIQPTKCQEILKGKLVSLNVKQERINSAEDIMIGSLAGGYVFTEPKSKKNVKRDKQ